MRCGRSRSGCRRGLLRNPRPGGVLKSVDCCWAAWRRATGRQSGSEPIPARHPLRAQVRASPSLVLDDVDKVGLEKAASGHSRRRRIGWASAFTGASHPRGDSISKNPDLDLIRRYFSDPSDLVLPIRSGERARPSARFYVCTTLRGARGPWGIFSRFSTACSIPLLR